jgi:hypothetical protein
MTLEATSVLQLSELERQTLQEVALEKIKALSLGVDVKIPKGIPLSSSTFLIYPLTSTPYREDQYS